VSVCPEASNSAAVSVAECKENPMAFWTGWPSKVAPEAMSREEIVALWRSQDSWKALPSGFVWVRITMASRNDCELAAWYSSDTVGGVSEVGTTWNSPNWGRYFNIPLSGSL
jgi:hypothetical protein